jgi:Transposase
MRRPAFRGMRYAPGYALEVQRRPVMKKRSSSQKSQKITVKPKGAQECVTIGMDLGDKTSRYCMLGNEGEILREGQVATTKTGIVEAFGSLGRVRIAIEVGTHSPWVSRLLLKLGHEMIVANPRQVKLITESSRKDDRLDAQTLARLARIDPQLLRPIQHPVRILASSPASPTPTWMAAMRPISVSSPRPRIPAAAPSATRFHSISTSPNKSAS